MPKIILQLIPGEFAVCRLPPTAARPTWADSGAFCSVTRTADELSIICPAGQVPASFKTERGWELLKCVGPFDFGTVGILASLAEPLARAGVGLLTLGTFDTDYLLIKTSQMNEAVRVLESAGHSIRYR